MARGRTAAFESAREIKATDRFSNRVEGYRRFRPGYPETVVAHLEGRLGRTGGLEVADIGSGTGIFSRLLLERGHRVFAVEPNAEMRGAAEAALSASPGFVSIAGGGEATTLAGGSVDLVTAAQAFHWLDRARARAEFRRILRPPRLVALLWNDRRTDDSEFAAAYEALLQQFGTDYNEVNHRNLGAEVFDDFFGPGRWKEEIFGNEQRLDLEGLRGRVASSSYVPAPGQPGHAEMFSALDRIFEATSENGFVTMRYDCRVFAGELPAP